MKKYTVTGKITITTYTTVEANSEEEALKLAEKRDDKMFISSNNGDTAEDVWMVDELDGDPYELSIED